MPKAPRKRRIETVVEEAPSHDGNPAFAAYQRQFPGDPIRPLWTHCIYDATPQAADSQHISYVARITHENTYRARQHDGSRERIEVIGVPMPSDATDEQRATKCREHHVTEMNSRKAAKRDDWCIPGTLQRNSYLRVIYVTYRFGNGWEQMIKRHISDSFVSPGDPDVLRKDPNGSFLLVLWEKGDEIILEEGEQPWPDISVSAQKIATLDYSLGARQENAYSFD